MPSITKANELFQSMALACTIDWLFERERISNGGKHSAALSVLMQRKTWLRFYQSRCTTVKLGFGSVLGISTSSRTGLFPEIRITVSTFPLLSVIVPVPSGSIV